MGWIVAALVGVAVLVVWVIYINRSWTEEEVERAKVDVQQRVCFALMADGQEVAYFSRFSERDSAFVGLTTNQDSAWVKSENVGVWVNSSSSFPSANGLILAVDEESQMESQAKFVSKELGVMMERNRLRMEDEMKRAASIADEVDYYLLHHSIADNEYIGVANYSYALTSDMRHMKKMSALLDSLMLHARKMEVKVVREYEKDGIPLRLANGFLERPSLLHMRSENEEVLLLSYDVVNKSIPIILCAEEDVEGEHGASIGQMSDDILYYMQSRGIPEDTAYEMMARSGVSAAAAKIPTRFMSE